MKLFVTIYEKTPQAALDAIRALSADHDGVELRAEDFGEIDYAEFRAATGKTLLLTHRGKQMQAETMRRAIEAGFDLVDVEFSPGRSVDAFRERVVISHHDYEGMPDLPSLVREMRATGCAYVKIAATPKNFKDNERLLAAIGDRVSVIGMGQRGLYSRVLAPFRGSELCFVSTSDAREAAPAQLTLDRALAIYGPHRETLHADRVFAIAGNRAGPSLSPPIHNALFREKGVSAAYTIASIESFAEIEEPFLAGEPCGLSVTIPFKLDAFQFAKRCGATIGPNARESGAVNTLVRARETIADNTDVDGFETLMREICGRDRKSVAIVGAGGTARAALIAAGRAGMHVTLFNRSQRPLGRIEPLESLRSFDGEVIINTLPPVVEPEFTPRAGMTYIGAAYGTSEIDARHEKLRAAGVQVFDGLDLLRAQAVRQHELFMRVFE